MLKIFVSYRRADSRKDAGRLYDRLVEAFGKDYVFKDVNNLQYGEDFRGVLSDAVSGCQVLLSVIGQQWLTVKDDAGQRRLDNPDDFVRIEVRTALQRDKCLVIPVLVDGAIMPKAAELPDDLQELTYKHAILVRDDPDFHPDVTRLIESLSKHGVGDSKTSSTHVYDVHDAITRFYESFEKMAWDDARAVLSEIRASGKAPRVFNIDNHEKEVWDAILAQERDKEYETLRLMTKRGSPALVWEGLQVFWETYPNYDPDNLARFKPVSPSSFQRARDFIRVGQRNTDWTPRITTFADLKIPDMTFCLVPTGKFWMGNDSEMAYWDNKQSQWIKGLLDGGVQTFEQPFYLAQYPVTNAQWALAVKAGVVNYPAEVGDALKWYNDPQLRNIPVVGVSWEECQKFAAWLNCRLPTEAEWEYSARGVDALFYPWGNEFIADNVVYSANSRARPNLVTGKPSGASWIGASHLSGNVWEWCSTSYQPYPYVGIDGREDLNASGWRVVRGGSWNDTDDVLRVANRVNNTTADSDVGFRCARSYSPTVL